MADMRSVADIVSVADMRSVADIVSVAGMRSVADIVPVTEGQWQARVEIWADQFFFKSNLALHNKFNRF